MRKIILLTIFSVLTTFSYGQCPDPPSVDTEQFFCSATAWMLIGESADNLSDLQVFPDAPGWSLTWYEDDAGVPGTMIANPNNEQLVSGTVYHVTQTDTANCESDPLQITLAERDCACIKDPTFELQDGTPSDRGYTYSTLAAFDHHKTCGQGPMNNLPNYARGTTDAMTAGNQAVFVTPGMDPTAGVDVTKTNPINPSSSHGFRLGRNQSSPATVSSMQKSFIAGEVFVFNFSLALQNPNHSFETMPFAQVNLYDQNNNRVASRCIVSDASDCIFNPIGTGANPTAFYTDWSCIKLNTFEFQGQALRAEFYVADCAVSGGAHWAYMYVDDIYVGDDNEEICGNASFGYALIDTIEPAGQNCFISAQSQQALGCGFGTIAANVAGFPIEVCGLYDAPISQGPPPSLDEIVLNIIQNDNVVGTVVNPSAGNDPNTFCFIIDETDINVLPYGDFTFELVIDFVLDCGDPYNFFVDDRSGATLCPRAGCPLPLIVCDTDISGFSSFDLTEAEINIYGNVWDSGDIIISYFENEQDAHDEANAIPDPTDYENTIAGGQTIYVRLDWAIPQLSSDCYYLAELELTLNELPDLRDDRDIIICGSSVQNSLIGTPENIEDLGTVTYTWFKDNNQIPHVGSSYDVTESGVYTVVVSHMGCDASRTFTVSKVDYDVDLGNDVEICDETSSHVINSNVVIDPDSDPIDPDDFTYLWSTGETTENITVTTSGLYWLEVTVDNCTIIDQVQVSFRNFEVDLGDDVSICDVSLGHDLFADLTDADLNEVTYLWSTGETTPNITVYNFGTYTVDVSWGTCVQTDQVTITEVIPAEITLGSTIMKCENDVVDIDVQFIDANEGNLIYTWYLDGGMLPENTQSISVTDFGLYRVEVDNNGCISEAEVLVEGYPSNPDCIITQGISPEGSIGQNDNLNLEFLAIRTGIENLQIFNRNGTQVYERQNYVNEWTGQTTDGDNLPTGLYFYIINFTAEDAVHGIQKTGYIYINRGMN